MREEEAGHLKRAAASSSRASVAHALTRFCRLPRPIAAEAISVNARAIWRPRGISWRRTSAPECLLPARLVQAENHRT